MDHPNNENVNRGAGLGEREGEMMYLTRVSLKRKQRSLSAPKQTRRLLLCNNIALRKEATGRVWKRESCALSHVLTKEIVED